MSKQLRRSMFCSCMHVCDYALADFGLAKVGVSHAHKGAGSFCGTAEYLAPEMIKRVGHGTAVDWWALGMVLFEFLSGFPPWYKSFKTSEDRETFFHDVIHEELDFPAYVSPNARSVIEGTDQFDLCCESFINTVRLFFLGFLNKDPQQRLGANGGEEILSHPFFCHIDWRRLYHRQVRAPGRPPADTGTFAHIFNKFTFSFDVLK